MVSKGVTNATGRDDNVSRGPEVSRPALRAGRTRSLLAHFLTNCQNIASNGRPASPAQAPSSRAAARPRVPAGPPPRGRCPRPRRRRPRGPSTRSTAARTASTAARWVALGCGSDCDQRTRAVPRTAAGSSGVPSSVPASRTASRGQRGDVEGGERVDAGRGPGRCRVPVDAVGPGARRRGARPGRRTAAARAGRDAGPRRRATATSPSRGSAPWRGPGRGPSPCAAGRDETPGAARGGVEPGRVARTRVTSDDVGARVGRGRPASAGQDRREQVERRRRPGVASTTRPAVQRPAVGGLPAPSGPVHRDASTPRAGPARAGRPGRPVRTRRRHGPRRSADQGVDQRVHAADQAVDRGTRRARARAATRRRAASEPCSRERRQQPGGDRPDVEVRPGRRACTPPTTGATSRSSDPAAHPGPHERPEGRRVAGADARGQQPVQARPQRARPARSCAGRPAPTGPPGRRAAPARGQRSPGPDGSWTHAPSGAGRGDRVRQARARGERGDRPAPGRERLGARVEVEARRPGAGRRRRPAWPRASSTVTRSPAAASVARGDEPGDPAADHDGVDRRHGRSRVGVGPGARTRPAGPDWRRPAVPGGVHRRLARPARAPARRRGSARPGRWSAGRRGRG